MPRADACPILDLIALLRKYDLSTYIKKTIEFSFLNHFCRYFSQSSKGEMCILVWFLFSCSLSF